MLNVRFNLLHYMFFLLFELCLTRAVYKNDFFLLEIGSVGNKNFSHFKLLILNSNFFSVLIFLSK